uniref:Uncharacterized protein n=1 Tax=Anopheles culicifacies TaxID=139723 RepID=A0A182M020_9DIPT
MNSVNAPTTSTPQMRLCAIGSSWDPSRTPSLPFRVRLVAFVAISHALTCTAQLRKQLFCPGPFSSPLAWRTGHWPPKPVPFIIWSASGRKLPPAACAGRAAACPPVVLLLRALSGWTGGPKPVTSTTLKRGAEDDEETVEGNDIIAICALAVDFPSTPVVMNQQIQELQTVVEEGVEEEEKEEEERKKEQQLLPEDGERGKTTVKR